MADLNGRPLVWLRISRTVIGCFGLLSSTCSLSCSTASHWPLNSGRYFSTGSSSFTLPSSTSIIKAVAVIGLDCEAIQNTAVRVHRLAGRDVGEADRFEAQHLVLVGHERDGAGQRVPVDERLQCGGDLSGSTGGRFLRGAALRGTETAATKRETSGSLEQFRALMTKPSFFSLASPEASTVASALCDPRSPDSTGSYGNWQSWL